MKSNFAKKILIVLTVLAVLGIGATGFAYRGQCLGNQSDDYCRGWQKGGPGYGADMGNRGCGKRFSGKQGAGGKGCLRKGADLSEDQIKQLTEACSAFREANSELRSQIKSKRLELESEFVKTKPDVEKLKTLQKELSDLKAQFAQKRIEQRLKMKAVHPDLPCAKGWKSGGGFGHGNGHGRKCGRAM